MTEIIPDPVRFMRRVRLTKDRKITSTVRCSWPLVKIIFPRNGERYGWIINAVDIEQGIIMTLAEQVSNKAFT
jgi:hypothetical protein